jgi:branched-chain amino acid transport system substrate-binding protein
MKVVSTIKGIALFALAAVATQAAIAAQIVVAEVAPLSGQDAIQGRAYSVGMELSFENANRVGTGGHTFTLVRKDDGGRPDETVTVTRQLLAETRPLVLAGYFGNRNIDNLIGSGLLEKERIPLIGYRVTEIRPDTPLLYSVRAGLRDEISKMTEHLATIGITRLGLLFEEGPSAAALVSSANEAAQKSGARIIVKASYPAGSARVSPAVATMIAASPQAIIMVAGGAAAAGFIEQYRTGGGLAQLFAHSGADIEQLSKRLSEEQMQGVAIAQVTPNPYRISGRLSKEFIDTAAKAKDLEVPVSYAMMEGFITGKIIVEAVRRQGAKPTRQGLIEALDAMGSFDLGGYNVGYKPGMHAGSKFVELSIVTGAGKIRQ